MGFTRKVAVVLGGICFLTGCQTIPYQGQARDIKRKPQAEGIVAIPVNFRDEDRTVAEQKMAGNCGAGQYKVLEEGEVAVGQQTKSSGTETHQKSTEQKVGTLFGLPIVSGDPASKNSESSQTVTQIKEWQISYKCVGSNSTDSEKKKVR